MRTHRRTTIVTGMVSAMLVAHALAHDYNAGYIRIVHPCLRATPPVAPVAGVYLRLINTGSESDGLLGVSSEIDEEAEIHESIRAKLMYGVKLHIDSQVLKTYRGYVKAGMTGNASVKINAGVEWPARRGKGRTAPKTNKAVTLTRLVFDQKGAQLKRSSNLIWIKDFKVRPGEGHQRDVVASKL